MLVQKLNEKMDSWLDENVSEKTKKIKLEAESNQFIYNSITNHIVESLKPIENNTLFKGEYSIQIKLPEGEKSPIDCEYLIREGVRLAWIINIYSLPLLMKKLEKDKEEIEASGKGKMELFLEDTDGKKDGKLKINVEMKNEKVNFQEETPVEETSIIEETPKLSRKKSFWNRIFRR